jgi:hypothetical protein
MDEFFEKLIAEYLPQYEKEKLEMSSDSLLEFIKKSEKEAYEKHLYLLEPKTCSLSTYTKLYTRSSLEYDFAVKNLKPVNNKDLDDPFKELKKYFTFVSVDVSEPLGRKLYDAKREERAKIWKEFKLPVKKIDKQFRNVCEEKTRFANKKGYKNLLDLHIDLKKIPHDKYKQFKEKIDEVIEFCNKQLPKPNQLPNWFYSECNPPCVYCQLNSFPFTNEEDVFKTMKAIYPILIPFKKKIEIKQDDSSYMRYEKNTDSFEIRIDRSGNLRHRTIDLVHELCHVVDYLNNFKEDKNPHENSLFMSEKVTLELELHILQKVSPELYKASFCQILALFHNLLFQIEMHTKPQDNASELRAQIFNRCFLSAHQKKNYLYMLNELNIMRPLKGLPHAVAAADVILDIIHKK